MNFRTEITLEIVRDNLSFRYIVPFNTSYELAHEVCLKMAEGVMEMKKQSDATKAAVTPSAATEESVVS
jgi:hypothetical protein